MTGAFASIANASGRMIWGLIGDRLSFKVSFEKNSSLAQLIITSITFSLFILWLQNNFTHEQFKKFFCHKITLANNFDKNNPENCLCVWFSLSVPCLPVQTKLNLKNKQQLWQESLAFQILDAFCSRFWKSLVEVESTNWGVVKLFNTQNKLMDVHQSDISKILLFSTSNLVSFIVIKSHHFTEAYLILLHKTSHTSCVLFFVWFPCVGSRKSTPSVSSR